MLDQAIGEYDVVMKVGFIEIKSFEEDSNYIKYSFKNFPKKFDEFIKKYVV